MIDAHNSDADTLSAATLFELCQLFLQIPHDSVDLLDHRLCENFHFHPYFNRGGQTAGDLEAFVNCGSFPWHKFTERAIATAGLHSLPAIRAINDPFVGRDALRQLFRLAEGEEVFVEV